MQAFGQVEKHTRIYYGYVFFLYEYIYKYEGKTLSSPQKPLEMLG